MAESPARDQLDIFQQALLGPRRQNLLVKDELRLFTIVSDYERFVRAAVNSACEILFNFDTKAALALPFGTFSHTSLDTPATFRTFRNRFREGWTFGEGPFMKTMIFAVAALLTANIATLDSAQAQSAGPTCSAGFIQSYRHVVLEIKKIAASVKANQNPDNIPQAVFACNRLEKLYPSMTCDIGNQTAHSGDLDGACTQIRTVAEKMGVQPAPDVPPPAAKDVTDATSVSTLADNGLVMKVNDAATFNKLAADPKSFFMIDGAVTDFNGAIASNSSVRCTVAFPLDKVATTVNAGQTFKSELLEEENQIGDFYLRVAFAGTSFTVDCSQQVVPTPGVTHGTTLGELKKAFGRTATFTYAP